MGQKLPHLRLGYILEKKKSKHKRSLNYIWRIIQITNQESVSESIIPKEKLVFGLYRRTSVNLEGLIGDSGKIIGLEHFLFCTSKVYWIKIWIYRVKRLQKSYIEESK
jgi:hypothetical protein